MFVRHHVMYIFGILDLNIFHFVYHVCALPSIMHIYYIFCLKYSSCSACLLQPEKPNYTKVLQYCDNVIEISPDNVKALYRRGVAMYHLKRPEEALDTLKHAVNLPDGQKGSYYNIIYCISHQTTVYRDMYMCIL